MKSMADRIAEKEKELRSLKERHQKAEAQRKRDEADRARKNAERRTVLVGTLVLEKVERGEIPEAQFRKWVDSGLKESEDRALFDL